jgi:hypothetical protein
MVQLLHIPLHCDHDTCSISISFRKQIRISNPYIKLAALRMLGPAVHTSAFVSNAAPDTCVIASHGSSGHFSLWQLLHNPCSSYARCFLCPSSPSSSSSSSSSFLSEALASFCYRRTDRSICIVAARASAVEIWLYPAGSLARDTSAAAAKGDDGTLVASVPSGPCCVTAMAALRFESEACRALGGSAQAAVSFVIGFDDGSLRELHVDVWGDDVGGSVSCWVLPSLRSVTERYAVKFIRFYCQQKLLLLRVAGYSSSSSSSSRVVSGFVGEAECRQRRSSSNTRCKVALVCGNTADVRQRLHKRAWRCKDAQNFFVVGSARVHVRRMQPRHAAKVKAVNLRCS